MPGAVPVRPRAPRGGALVLTICALAACTPEKPPNLVVVVLDTLRADAVSFDPQRDTTPVLRRLAEGGVRFTTAYAHTPLTGPSHATLLTSLSPLTHGLVKNGQHLTDDYRTLAEVLRDRGYQTAAMVSAMPIYSMFGFAQGFDVFDAGVSRRRFAHERYCTRSLYETCGEEATERARDWLETKRDPERPFLLFVHYYDPHAAYDAPPPFAIETPLTVSGDDDDCARKRSRYLAEVRFTDHEVGRLLDAVAAAAPKESTLVALTADHGEAFWEHGHCGHDREIHEELTRIPLLLSWPSHLRAGTVIEEPVGLIDVMPTLLDLMGIEDDGANLEGRNLAPALRGEEKLDPEHPIFLVRTTVKRWDGAEKREPGSQTGVRVGHWKYLRDNDQGPGQLYDLDDDPDEKYNRVGSQPQRTKAMAERLAAWRAEHARGGGDRLAQSAQVEVSQDVQQKLETLGYVQ